MSMPKLMAMKPVQVFAVTGGMSAGDSPVTAFVA